MKYRSIRFKFKACRNEKILSFLTALYVIFDKLITLPVKVVLNDSCKNTQTLEQTYIIYHSITLMNFHPINRSYS